MDTEQLYQSLTPLQRRALLFCERDGNGAYPYCLYPLAKLGLMALQPSAKLMGISVYRLTPLGYSVRAYAEALNNES